jgi:hypothetical protein
MKISNWPVPETFAVALEEESKWKVQVLPLDSDGNSKVRRVVTSVVRPSLKTLPKLSLWCTAPVQTSYREVDVGLMIGALFGRPDGSTGLIGEGHGGLQAGGLAQAEAVGSGYEGTAAGRADAKAMTIRARAEVEKCMTVAKKGERGRGRTEGRSSIYEGRKEREGW